MSITDKDAIMQIRFSYLFLFYESSKLALIRKLKTFKLHNPIVVTLIHMSRSVGLAIYRPQEARLRLPDILRSVTISHYYPIYGSLIRFGEKHIDWRM